MVVQPTKSMILVHVVGKRNRDRKPWREGRAVKSVAALSAMKLDKRFLL
jgi:hypothetical protein